MSYIATIGFFDGVHLGHRYLFSLLRQIAEKKRLQPLIVTFRQPPRLVLDGGYKYDLLTSSDERESLLGREAEVCMLDFSQVYTLTARQFLQLLYCKNVRALLMGYDHRFGSDGITRIADYQDIGKSVGIEIVRADVFLVSEIKVSSTKIRKLLCSGDVEQANSLLGYVYSITGVVERGNGIGHKLGYPTANIRPVDACKIVPMTGVYAAVVETLGKKAILNIGTNPTVGNTHMTIEVHIPEFDEDLYGKTLRIGILRRLREERHFPSLDALRQQISQDLSQL